MPYTLKNLPSNIKKYSKKIQEIWLKAFNNAYKQYDGDDSKAFAIANGVIKKYKAKKELKKYSGEKMSIEYLQLDDKPVKPGKVTTSIEKLDEKVKDSDELQEQLTVIKEVRTELAKAYTDIKSVNILNEQLTKDAAVLKEQIKDIEVLKNELQTYKLKEVEVEKLAYNSRLAKLSESFKYLGQVKTIEELSKLDKKTVDELEKVTKLAISTKASEKLDSVTMPTQAIQPKKIEQPKQVETLNEKSFAENICGALTAQQDNQERK